MRDARDETIESIDANLSFRDGPGNTQILDGDDKIRVANYQVGTNKTSARREPIAAVVLHYTASKSTPLPAAQLGRFRKVLLPKRVETVSALFEGPGALEQIPAGLRMCLQNAASKREASWDYLVSDAGMIVQCNLEPNQRYTWHAGRSTRQYRGKRKDVVYTDPWTKDKHVVWDASERRFTYPEFPDGSVPDSGNRRTLGIEIENYGRVFVRQGKYYQRSWSDGKYVYRLTPLTSADVVADGNRYYERIGDETWASLVALARALCLKFNIPRDGWFGHQQFVPDRRTDPEPPLNIDDLVNEVYGPSTATRRAAAVAVSCISSGGGDEMDDVGESERDDD